MKPVKLSELMEAVEFDSEEGVPRVDLETGQVVLVEQSVLSAVEEDDEEILADLADWQKKEVEIARAIVADSGKRFLNGPNKFEFHEYRQMELFIGTLASTEAAGSSCGGRLRARVRFVISRTPRTVSVC